MEIVIGWVILAVLVGVFADSRGRSGVGFALLSVLLSPLLGLVIVLVIPDLNKQKEAELWRQRDEEQRQRLAQRDHEKQLEALKAIAANKVAEAPPIRSMADEIAKLGELRDKGLLTQEEFQEQKSALLKGA